GFDIVATTGEEVKNPKRTLPLAILSTLGIVLLLYLLVTAATAGTLSGHQLNTKTPLADAARQLFGTTGQQLIAIAAILTTAASGNALLAATSRITFAMARDGLLPRFLTYLHPSTRAPWIAIIANGVIFSLFALTDSISLLAAIGSALYVLQFIFPLAALAIVRYRSKTVPSFRIPTPHLILPLAFGGCLLLLFASGQKGIEASLGWLAVGLIIHAGFQGVVSYIRRRRYLKKGYLATRAEITTRKDQISTILHDPQMRVEQLEAMQARIAELKQLRVIQARIEEVEQFRSAQIRIEERKHLRSIQARTEELELLQMLQAGIEGFKQFRATQVHIEELKFLRALQAQSSKEGEIIALESTLHEAQQELQTTQELQTNL
ncbi:MAG TPA: APC family permease, partial [Ktedonobacteraceae bacterium]